MNLVDRLAVAKPTYKDGRWSLTVCAQSFYDCDPEQVEPADREVTVNCIEYTLQRKVHEALFGDLQKPVEEFMELVMDDVHPDRAERAWELRREIEHLLYF